MPDTTTFDPVAMGLVPLMYNQANDPEIQNGFDMSKNGTQYGWGKELDGNQVVNYDMEGKETYRGTQHRGPTPLQMALLFAGGSALGAGLLGSAGSLSAGGMGAAGSDLAAMSGIGEIGAGAGGASIGGGAALSAESLIPSLSTFGGELGGGLATMGETVAGMEGASTAALSTAAPGATSTLGTLTGAGYAAPALEGSLASGLTAGGATAGLGAAGTTVAGYGGVTGMLAGAGLSSASTLSEISTWIKANKELASMAFAGVAGAIKSAADVEAAAKLAQSKLDQLELVQKQKLEDNARTSASVSGLRKPGLISQAPLTRLGGTPVFGSTGLINRG